MCLLLNTFPLLTCLYSFNRWQRKKSKFCLKKKKKKLDIKFHSQSCTFGCVCPWKSIPHWFFKQLERSEVTWTVGTEYRNHSLAHHKSNGNSLESTVPLDWKFLSVLPIKKVKDMLRNITGCSSHHSSCSGDNRNLGSLPPGVLKRAFFQQYVVMW